MLEELNNKLTEVKERLREKQKTEKALKIAEQNLATEKARFKELEKVLKKEFGDVQKLDGLSLEGLFYTILGSKEQKIEKERQEYLAAKLKYDECTASFDALFKEAAYQVQQILRRFRQELDDIGPGSAPDINIDIGSFTTFADFFFDGLIVDWIVQSGISKSREKTIAMEKAVRLVVTSLEQNLLNLEKRVQETHAKRCLLIENFC